MPVVVTRGNTKYYQQTIKALLGNTIKFDQIIVVNWDTNTTSDNNLQQINQKISDKIITIEDTTIKTFIQGVRVAVNYLKQNQCEENKLPAYLYLLHDDSRPDEKALKYLCDCACENPQLQLIGSKQLSYNGRFLLESGLLIDKNCKRVNPVYRGEIDQGHRDKLTLLQNSKVFACGLAGSLVSFEVFDLCADVPHELAQFDDSMYFCRNLHLAGFELAVEPKAIIYHAQYALHGNNYKKILHSSLFYRLTTTNFVLLHTFGLLLKMPFNFIRSLIRKRHPAAQFTLPFWTIKKLGRIFRARKQMQALVQANTSSLKTDGENNGNLTGEIKAKSNKINHRTVLRALNEFCISPTTYKQLKGEKETLDEQKGSIYLPSSKWAKYQAIRLKNRKAIFCLIIILSAMTLLLTALLFPGAFFGDLFNGKTLVGGSLAASDASFWQVLDAASTNWVGAIDGVSECGNPLLFLLLPLCVFGLKYVLVILFLTLPFLSGLFAFFMAGVFTRRSSLRILLGIFWFTSPDLLYAYFDGRLSAMLFHAMLPLVIFGLVKTTGMQKTDLKLLHSKHQEKPSFGVLCATGLALAFCCACTPLFFLFSTAFILVYYRIAPKKKLIILLPSLILLLPLGLRVSQTIFTGGLSLLLADSSVPSVYKQPDLWQILLGQPVDNTNFVLTNITQTIISLVQYLSFAGVVLIILFAVGALFSHTPLINILWPIGCVGILWAIVSTKITVANEYGEAVKAWPGYGLSLFLLTMGLATILLLDKRGVILSRFCTIVCICSCIFSLGLPCLLSTQNNISSVKIANADFVPIVGRRLYTLQSSPNILFLQVTKKKTVEYSVLNTATLDYINVSATSNLDEAISSKNNNARVKDLIANLSYTKEDGPSITDQLRSLGIGGIIVPTKNTDSEGYDELVMTISRIDDITQLINQNNTELGVRYWVLNKPPTTKFADYNRALTSVKRVVWSTGLGLILLFYLLAAIPPLSRKKVQIIRTIRKVRSSNQTLAPSENTQIKIEEKTGRSASSENCTSTTINGETND